MVEKNKPSQCCWSARQFYIVGFGASGSLILWYIRKSKFFCPLDLPVLWARKKSLSFVSLSTHYVFTLCIYKLNMKKFLFEQHKKSICV